MTFQQAWKLINFITSWNFIAESITLSKTLFDYCSPIASDFFNPPIDVNTRNKLIQ